MNLKIEFNDLAFRAAMKEAAVKLRANGPELVKEEARLFIGEYMKRTPPFRKGTYGKHVGTKEDYEAGKNVIKGDLAEVAGHAERGYLQWVSDTFGNTQIKQQLYKKGSQKPYLIDWDAIAYSIGELAKFHRSKLSKYGRPPNIYKGGKKEGGTATKDVGRWVARNKVIVPSEVYFGYLKQLYDAIGSAKASFNEAAFALGMKRIPPWVRRHGNFGTYSEQGDPSNFNVVIGGQSKVPGAQRTVDEAIAIRAKKFTAEMKRLMKTFAATGKIATRRKSFNT
jgi:hypothetical protein